MQSPVSYDQCCSSTSYLFEKNAREKISRQTVADRKTFVQTNDFVAISLSPTDNANNSSLLQFSCHFFALVPGHCRHRHCRGCCCCRR